MLNTANTSPKQLTNTKSRSVAWDPVLDSTRSRIFDTIYSTIPADWVAKGGDYTVTIHPKSKPLPAMKLWIPSLTVVVDRKSGKDRFSVSSSQETFSSLDDFDAKFPHLVTSLVGND